jgi:hypothetical protein
MKSKNWVGGVLAVSAMMGFLLILTILMFHDVPTANKESFNVGLEALKALLTLAFGYYLGSSYGSQQKDKVIEEAGK